MKVNSRRVFIFALGMAATMYAIFWFSSQSGSSSQRLSDGLLYDILNLAGVWSPTLEESMGVLLRKCAHFAEFFILGFFSCRLSLELTKHHADTRFFPYLSAILFCGLYACSDELHQLFVPGRAARIGDVVLDTIGSAAAVFSVKAFIYFRRGENGINE